ncbi:hypothetical protein P0D75_38730 [Paraburkholderia sediminicola]|uniref:type II toxin-antitoxin system Phd/YefM family antitoxin n=1 Tax=Paraburkholderia sediminicola TaxID=458836 RepID=UPI0038BA92EC
MTEDTANDPIFPAQLREGGVTRVERGGKAYVVLSADEYDSLVETAHLMSSDANIRELGEGLDWVEKAFGRDSLILGPEDDAQTTTNVLPEASKTTRYEHIQYAGPAFTPARGLSPALFPACSNHLSGLVYSAPTFFAAGAPLTGTIVEEKTIEKLLNEAKTAAADLNKKLASLGIAAIVEESIDMAKKSSSRHPAKSEQPKVGALRKTQKTRHG